MLCAHARPIFLIWFIHAPGGSGIVGPWGSSTYRDMSLHQSTSVCWAKPAVHAADPVNDENDLGGCVVDIGHHLMDEGTHDALLQPRIGRRCGPDGLYQQTFIDTYAKVACAKLYDRKTPITAADLLNDRMIPFFDSHDVKLLRVLTDRGSESPC